MGVERDELLGTIWEEAIAFEDDYLTSFLNEESEEMADIREALRQALTAGVSRESLCAFAETVRYEAAYTTLQVHEANALLSEEGLSEDLLAGAGATGD